MARSRNDVDSRLLALALVASGAFGGFAACSSLGADPSGNASGSGAGGTGATAQGENLYVTLCARCHGPKGEGDASTPALRNWGKGKPALVEAITGVMPKGNPEKCTGNCPSLVADYILANFKGDAPACTSVSPGKRALRLLSRREYQATIADLLQPGQSSASTCTSRTFTFSPGTQTYKSVHVAGSFNGWPKTVAEGGWPMTFDAQKKVWSTTHTVVPGTYPYKFVLDEATWVSDPTNPASVPDGFGGQNSVLSVSCTSNNQLPFDPTTTFPADARPVGFPFDDEVGRVVTGNVVDAYWKAGFVVGQAAVEKGLAPLVSCDPKADAKGCAETFVRSFGKRAFRRPLSDAEVARFRGVVLTPPDFTKGVANAIAAFLSAPSFLYRSEMGEPQPDGTYRLTPWEVASALSYTLWGTTPDAALLDAADKGELATAAGVEKQARRLLGDPRARDAVASFAEQWLGAENIRTVDKNAGMFPGFDKDVREALAEETRRLVTHVVFDGSHAFEEILTAGYTFVNEKNAPLYGMTGVTGTDLAKRDYVDARAGVLGHASVLGVLAHSDQTSPIRRGLFVRRNLLCETFGTPPPNAGGVPKVDPNATTAERFSQHSADKACSGCHKYIDPVGLGFEYLDPIGRIRTTDAGKPVTKGGDMIDVEHQGAGTSAPFADVKELASTLAKSEAAKTCFVKQVHRFAHGRLEDADASCAVSTLRSSWKAKGNDVRELFVAVVTSPDFLVRK